MPDTFIPAYRNISNALIEAAARVEERKSPRARYIDAAEALAWEELEGEHRACARWRNLHVEGCRKDAAQRWDDALAIGREAWAKYPGDAEDKRDAAYDAIAMSGLADCDDLAEYVSDALVQGAV